MKRKKFLHKNSLREYQVLGNGPRILYAFHGFGRPSDDWQVFETWLFSEFTLFSFNDFFHGESEFTTHSLDNNFLEKEDIISFFSAFAEENKHLSVSLIAYSSGARTALTLIESPPFVIEDAWLFAPDGIKRSKWNQLFTQYRLVQKLFKWTIDHPIWFFRFAKGLNKIALLNSSLTSFVLFNMRNRQKRERVYNYWLIYKEINPVIKNVILSVNNNKIRLHLIFAQDDVVIESKIGKAFQKELGDNSDLLLLRGGHRLIAKTHLKQLMERYSIK